MGIAAKKLAGYIVQKAISKYIAAEIANGQQTATIEAKRLSDRARIAEDDFGNKRLVIDITEPGDELRKTLVWDMRALKRQSWACPENAFDDISCCFYENGNPPVDIIRSAANVFWNTNASNGNLNGNDRPMINVIDRVGHIVEAIEALRGSIQKNPCWNIANAAKFQALAKKWADAGFKHRFPAFQGNTADHESFFRSLVYSSGTTSMGSLDSQTKALDVAVGILKRLDGGHSIVGVTAKGGRNAYSNTAEIAFSNGEEMDIKLDDIETAVDLLNCTEANGFLYDMYEKSMGSEGGEASNDVFKKIQAAFSIAAHGAPVYNNKQIGSLLTAFKKAANKNSFKLPDSLKGDVDFHGHHITWEITGYSVGNSETKIEIRLLNSSVSDALIDQLPLSNERKADTREEAGAKAAINFKMGATFVPRSGGADFSYNILHWGELCRFVKNNNLEADLQKTLATSVINEVNKILATFKTEPAQGAQKTTRPSMSIPEYNRLMPALMRCVNDIKLHSVAPENIYYEKTYGGITLRAEIRIHASYSYDDKTIQNNSIVVYIKTGGRPDKVRKNTFKTASDCQDGTPEAAIMQNLSAEDLAGFTEYVKSQVIAFVERIEMEDDEALERLKERYPVDAIKLYLAESSNSPGDR